MISLLIYIKHRFQWIWNVVEWVNGQIFCLLYPTLSNCINEVLGDCHCERLTFSTVTHEDIASLEKFRQNQTTQYLLYFDPHPFDEHTLNRLLKNKSFAMMKATSNVDGRIVGYFFLRCFFIGKAFHGLIVDERCTNQGLGTVMWALSAKICNKLGLRMYATVSEHNPASLTSARNATDVTVVDKLANDYLLIRCKSKAKA